jgi:hypothetical protein
MLVELIAAYRMGTTVEAIQDVIFAYTGIDIQVVELYKLIGNGVYDQSDRNTISVAVNVGNSSSNPLTSVTSLAQLQTIIQSLYNAIALAKPAHVGIEFMTIFGETEDLDCDISPQFLTQQQYLVMTPAVQNYYTLTGYVPISPAVFWEPDTAFVLGNVLRDSYGNFQLLTSLGSYPHQSGSYSPPGFPAWDTASLGITDDGDLTWMNISPAVVSTAVASGVVTVVLSYPVGLSVGNKVTLIGLTGTNGMALNNVPLTVTSMTDATFTATTTLSDYSTETETTGTATFALPTPITALQWAELNSTWQSIYQQMYTNTNCSPLQPTQPWYHPGINDTLRIIIRLIEAAPEGPMLIQAPVLNPTPIPSDDSQIQRPPDNPKTTVAAYGRLLSPKLTPTQWAALPSIYVNILNGMANGTNAVYTYVPTTQFLHDGELLTVTGFANQALNVTAQIKGVLNLVANVNSTSVASNVVTVNATNQFQPGNLVTFAGLSVATFLNGKTLVVQSSTSTSFTVNYTTSSYTQVSDTGTGEVSSFEISLAQTIALQTPSPTADAGLVTPTLQSAYYLSNGNYILGIPPINNTGAGEGESWNPNQAVFQGQIIVDVNGNTQLALNAGTTGAISPGYASWSTVLNGTTADGSVVWRMVGRNVFSAPNTWIGVINFSVFPAPTPLPLTGEVGNWDSLHQYGLLAPRLSSVWEISGGDEMTIFGLY